MITIGTPDMAERAPRPGLTKIRGVPLLRRRRVQLVATLEGRWRDLLEGADVVSEGKAKQEDGVLVYYGTTSILISPRGTDERVDLAELARVLQHDPHTRLRFVRVARREASARAAAPLGSLRAEVTIRATTDGLVVTIDVVARVGRGERRASKRR